MLVEKLFIETLLVDLKERFGPRDTNSFKLAFRLYFDSGSVLVRLFSATTVYMQFTNAKDVFNGPSQWCSVDIVEPDSLERIYKFVQDIKESL